VPRAPKRAMAAQTVNATFGPPGERAADLLERGEHFEYRVTSRVALKRGASAMVPLLAAPIDARKERVWRAGSGPGPVLVLAFANGTGAVLEEGPAVFYDEEAYVGEVMVPYSARGVEVKLAYAKDLAVRCRQTSTQHKAISGVRLARQAVV